MKEQQQTILVTGGAGYVGSHSVLLLLQQGYRVVVIDNCCNTYVDDEEDQSDLNGNLTNNNNNNNNNNDIAQNQHKMPESLRRVERLADAKLAGFYRFDLVEDGHLGGAIESQVFRRHKFHACIHYAALKSVSLSISQPLEYYTNNLIGTINLLNLLRRNNCRNLIFSSSATIYGLPQYMPVDELHQVGLNVLNPYGRTKCMIEQILKDLCTAKQTSENCDNNCAASGKWNIICLRYFNPVGAHPSGYIGEHIVDIPNNLMPYISQVAIRKREKLYVFGNDFETVDGTGVRDFIHIMDLASGHTHALDHMLRHTADKEHTFKAYNLGTGRGHSVLEMIETFERVNNVRVPYEIVGRREGDAGEVYADASLARAQLGWQATRTLEDMCRDTYKWQSQHPDGYKTTPSPIVITRVANKTNDAVKTRASVIQAN